MNKTHKDTKYFDDALASYNRKIDRYISAIKSGDLNKTQIERRCEMLLGFYIRKIILLYSIKINRNQLTATIEEFLNTYKEAEFSIYGAYEEIVWFMSIYYCLDIKSDQIDALISDIEEEGFNDMLISSIISGFKSDYRVTSGFEFDKPYKRLEKLLKEKENGNIEDIKTYLTDFWYKESSDAVWYNTHNDKSGYDYVGYWSFESAALVKLFGLDDSELEGVDYYPYDLLRMNEPLV
ncbi:MAG: DUF1911 domain-containing protein [Flavobacteriaceae bacterium]|nr:DUF1911 domain-containing protein [Flavobacteriaceae bacterium]